MSDHMMKNVWLVGAGKMAQAYAPVLKSMHIEPVVIGRGAESAAAFEQVTGLPVIQGGLDTFLATTPSQPEAVIIAVNVVDLAPTAIALLRYCQPHILLEKPGVINSAQLQELASLKGADRLYIAYNRRFFSSVQAVKRMLEEDGGPVSCTFEFTEWGHRIEQVLDRKHPEEMKHWLIANSTHVIDLAFYLAGAPVKMDSTVSGSLPWHPSGSAFCGSGMTDRDATFAYHANWKAPGRWWVEVMSEKRRFRLCPLETVQVQMKGSVQWDEVALPDEDGTSKPGLTRMVDSFLSGPTDALCNFTDMRRHIPFYQRIAGYND